MPTSDPPETSMAVPLPAPPTAMVLVDDLRDVDEETAYAALEALRKHEIGVAVGGIAPTLIGIALLQLAANGVWSVPWQALLAAMAMCLASVPVILLSSRRAFVAECKSLGIAPALAKRLYGRVWRAQLRLEKQRSQRDRDRALVSSINGT